MSNYFQDNILNFNNIKQDDKKENNDFHFSYSKFSLYKECPLKYKFRYIDKIKEKPKSFFVFGEIVHSVLEYFFSKLPPPPFEELIELIEKKWEMLDQEKKNLFSDEDKIEKIKEKIRNVIRNFYIKHKDNKEIPFLLEYNSNVFIDGIVTQVVVDKIEYKGDGKILIVDYKTGKKDLNRSMDQLYFYQKVCEKDEFLVKKLNEKYRENYKNILVNNIVYYYVESLNEMVYKRATDDEINSFWDRVLKAVDDIKSKKFDPKPNQLSCSYCDYKFICPVYEKKNINQNEKNNLLEEYIKIEDEIKKLKEKQKKLEEKLIDSIDSEIKTTINDKTYIIKKETKYEYSNKDEVIEILKKYNYYEKASRPTVQSIIEILNSKDTPSKLKKELERYFIKKYFLKIQE